MSVMEHAASTAVFPEKAELKEQSVEDAFRSLNRIPLFMTELDETDGGDGENFALEAIRALAHEGTPVEVAQNFKDQGDGLARARAWKDARGCYDQALGALKAPKISEEAVVGISNDVNTSQDQNVRAEIEEKCLVNRALCNLELRKFFEAYESHVWTNLFIENYGSCKADCAAALRLNSRNLKAVYRYASAFMALDDISHAEEATSYGKVLDPSNGPFKTLSSKLSQRKIILHRQQQKRQDLENRNAVEVRTLEIALKNRNITNRTTSTAPNMEDAIIRLSDPINCCSMLIFPMLLLYPLVEQTDFIKGCEEQSTMAEHLDYVLPPPWDKKEEYTLQSVNCFMETANGSVIKVGIRLPLKKVLNSSNVELVDNMAKIYIVPKAKLDDWITAFKKHQRRS